MGLIRKRKRKSFMATKIEKMPIRVTFRTYDGRKVSFIATKSVKRRRRVNFWR